VDPERWKRIDEIFHAALEREASSRAAFLTEACKEDDSLREEVEDLLVNHEKQSSLFDSPPTDLAAELLSKQSTFQGAIAHYQIVKRIGSGGMGEVYLAEDTRLNRKVALKILPSEFTQDKDRVRRFEREARAVSGLNHPNILTIYDIGQFDSSSFIASEFIDGETLRQRMSESKLSLKEVLTIGIQAAEALDAAHRAGVIHRDIKPENIMLRKDGYVKVLDFGLAKLAEKQNQQGISNLDTQSAHTRAGIVIGTVRYMSPEQARGLNVDARSDIFSLGIVLYEMIAARPPFDGATSSDVIAAILEKHPPPLHMYGDFPDELQWIVTKALAKDPEERYQTAKELLTDVKRIKKRLDVDEELRGSDPYTIVQPVRKAKWVVSVLLALITIAGIYFLYSKVSPKIAASKIPFSKIKLTRLTSSGSAYGAVISPDGKYVVYMQEIESNQSLILKQLASDAEIQILTLPRNSYFGASRFSNDGQYILYIAYNPESKTGSLYRMPVLGGIPQKLIDDISLVPAISPDSKLFAFVRSTKDGFLLITAHEDGSNQRIIKSYKSADFFSDLEWAPDGKTIVSILNKTLSGVTKSQIEVLDLNGKQSTLPNVNWSSEYGGGDMEWFSDGKGLALTKGQEHQRQIYYLSYPSGKLTPITNDPNDYAGAALTQDSKSLVTTQASYTCSIWGASSNTPDATAQLTSGSFIDDGQLGISWTSDRKILFSCKDASGKFQLCLMNSDGTDRRRITAGESNKYWPVASNDGRFSVYNVEEENTVNIWQMDSNGNNAKILPFSKQVRWPRLTPDGEWVVCSTLGREKQQLLKLPVKGGKEIVLSTVEFFIIGSAISPDGKLIAYVSEDQQNPPEIRLNLIPSDGGSPIKSFVMDNKAFPNGRIHWTPDGHGVAYIRIENGIGNIYVQPIDGSKPRRLTNFPAKQTAGFAWSMDGKNIAYSRCDFSWDVVLIQDIQ
jgi:eukaryotic-like serine/threonine-protein kinase